MIQLKKTAAALFSISMFMIMMSACSTVPMLNINYNVPDKTGVLSGNKVFLEVRDSRQDREMLGAGAKEDFKNVSESISLAIAEGNEKAFKIGLFNIKGLMQRIFEERLRNLGMQVETGIYRNWDEPTVVIDLQSFKLDLIKGAVKRTWTANIAYNVEITDNGKVLASSRFSGESEKLKIMRRKEADSLMSDLLTDLANRLNAEDLLKQAGLI